ncbi:hypothetical protein [Reichenbachiella faecimaris]|nr:hypothetical protein [Reichenbachiella faecimaris]
MKLEKAELSGFTDDNQSQILDLSKSRLWLNSDTSHGKDQKD